MNNAMRFEPIETPEGNAALEQLRLLGFRLDSGGSAHRLIGPDSAQVNVYRLDGKHSLSGMIGNISDITRGDAAILALVVAQAFIDEQHARGFLPRWETAE